MGEVAFAQRDSGILVPTSTIEKQEYTIPHAEFKKLRRLMSFAREYDLIAMYFCKLCKQPVQLKQRDRIIEEVDGPGETKVNAGGGRFSLSCGCSAWDIR